MQACYRPHMEPSQAMQGLQHLRNALQELPRKLLARKDAPDDCLHGTISGECNYNFSFKAEGGGFFQTGMLVANAEKTPGYPVPLTCKWKRRMGDLSVEIQGVTTNMYQISADDVGTHICVEARPADLDDGLYGAVMGELGPFELDPGTRRNLDNALGLGGSKFQATQAPTRDQAPGGPRQELVIYVSATGVRVLPLENGVEKPKREVSAEYAQEYPKIIIHPLDTFRFDLEMSESRKLPLCAPSRAVRDLIALTIRCLHTYRFVLQSQVLNVLLPPPPPVQQSGAPNLDDRLDACIRLERLVKELNQAMLQKETSEKVLRNTKFEKKQLQEQLQESISGCTEVIVGLQEQVQEDCRAAPPVPIEQQRELLQEAQMQCQIARSELQKARRRLEEARTAPRAEEEARASVQRSRDQDRDFRGPAGSASSRTQDQSDHVHAQELKRFRADVEMLHNRKEQLRRQLQDKEAEKQELQDNFFYVKGQLDKWQLRVAQDSDGEGAAKELERHHQLLDNSREERMRLAARLETVLRESEKEKVYHEQQLERVTTANARLQEEKDRSQREVQRLSRMYAESVKQLQGEGLHSAGDYDTSDQLLHYADPEEVARVRARLQQIDDKLLQKQAENESLRNRIRKLAVD